MTIMANPSCRIGVVTKSAATLAMEVMTQENTVPIAVIRVPKVASISTISFPIYLSIAVPGVEPRSSKYLDVLPHCCTVMLTYEQYRLCQTYCK